MFLENDPFFCSGRLHYCDEMVKCPSSRCEHCLFIVLWMEIILVIEVFIL